MLILNCKLFYISNLFFKLSISLKALCNFRIKLSQSKSSDSSNVALYEALYCSASFAASLPGLGFDTQTLTNVFSTCCKRLFTNFNKEYTVLNGFSFSLFDASFCSSGMSIFLSMRDWRISLISRKWSKPVWRCLSFADDAETATRNALC